MMKFLIGMFLMFFSIHSWSLPTAKYTLKVIDQMKEPVSGANASISFMKPKSTGWGGQTYYVEGSTDSDGIYIGSGETEQYGVYGASKSGFYDTSYTYHGLKTVSGIIGFRRWQPWNPTLEVVLKAIKSPIAMYAYNASTSSISVPKLNEFIGYDLIKRDWVVPYGKGLTADFKFKLEKDVKKNGDFTSNLVLAFSNELDGIQAFHKSITGGSRLRSNHEAPIKGYKSTLSRIRAENSQGMTYPFRDDANYYFRVRCTEDEDSCLYGKIYGDIEFGSVSTKKTGVIRLGKFYLNPIMGYRNVEFDPKKNKFKNLPHENKVYMP